jgi:MoaA/NifB/PqqE/SkfB family radical SAM enzyme
MQCIHCANIEEPIESIDMLVFSDQLYEFTEYCSSILLLGGEPLISSDYELVINAAKRVSIPIINIVTNGHFIIQKVIPNIRHFRGIQISSRCYK